MDSEGSISVCQKGSTISKFITIKKYIFYFKGYASQKTGMNFWSGTLNRNFPSNGNGKIVINWRTKRKRKLWAG